MNTPPKRHILIFFHPQRELVINKTIKSIGKILHACTGTHCKYSTNQERWLVPSNTAWHGRVS